MRREEKICDIPVIEDILVNERPPVRGGSWWGVFGCALVWFIIFLL